MPRDISIPFTEADLEEIKTIFQKIPSYCNGSIPSSDCALPCESIDFERTPEQVEQYVQHWDKLFDGRIVLDEFLKICTELSDIATYAIGRARSYDKKGDGFISEDEFEELINLLVIHDPKLQEMNFEDFVKAADTNMDGLVSLEECAHWIERNIKTNKCDTLTD